MKILITKRHRNGNDDLPIYTEAIFFQLNRVKTLTVYKMLSYLLFQFRKHELNYKSKTTRDDIIDIENLQGHCTFTMLLNNFSVLNVVLFELL